jgi:hypothetical protein
MEKRGLTKTSDLPADRVQAAIKSILARPLRASLSCRHQAAERFYPANHSISSWRFQKDRSRFRPDLTIATSDRRSGINPPGCNSRTAGTARQSRPLTQIQTPTGILLRAETRVGGCLALLGFQCGPYKSATFFCATSLNVPRHIRDVWGVRSAKYLSPLGSYTLTMTVDGTVRGSSLARGSHRPPGKVNSTAANAPTRE